MTYTKFLKHCSLSILFVIVAYYFSLNLLIPDYSDDLCYKFKYTTLFESLPKGSPMGTDINAPVESIFDAVTSNIVQYARFNGRALVHTFVQYFCMFDSKIPYATVSSLLFLFLLVAIGKYCSKGKYNSFSFLFPLIVFSFIAGSKCLYNGIATGVNYVWSLAFCVLYLTLLLKPLNNGYYSKLLIATAFLGGFSHEAVSVAVSGALLLLIYRKKESLTKQQKLSIYIFMIGTVLLFIAPSNIIRFLGTSTSEDFVGLRIAFFKYIRWTYLLTFSFAVMKIKGNLRDFINENIYLCTAILVEFLFIMLVGVLNSRSVFFLEVAAGILFFRSLMHMNLGNYLVVICTFVVLAFIPVYVQLYDYQSEASAIIKGMSAEIVKSKGCNVVLKIRNLSVPAYLDDYIYRAQPGKDEWFLKIFKWRYNKNDIKLDYVD